MRREFTVVLAKKNPRPRFTVLHLTITKQSGDELTGRGGGCTPSSLRQMGRRGGRAIFHDKQGNIRDTMKYILYTKVV